MRSSDNLEIKEKEERHEYYTDWVRGTAFVLIVLDIFIYIYIYIGDWINPNMEANLARLVRTSRFLLFSGSISATFYPNL